MGNDPKPAVAERRGQRTLSAARPRWRHLPRVTSGGFWGLLFGLIFFVPLPGLATGAQTKLREAFGLSHRITPVR
jgi:hypothetical protein